ncbi:hypothetical protein MATL_G00082970 [Megalops atlanticus]|uniref:DBP10 C-terminal domain-containing protein n=1 Tax=Megalops atlanticus TaxID=7932 RepID=A0A9D3Q5K2_MEGAT|nr:hypothetical protein MATL_G00082970 [Megalops atlanticus]
MGDEGDRLNQHKNMMKWDRKRKRFVRETGKEDKKKKVRTESGQLVRNAGKKNFYEEWKKKYKVEDGGSDSEGETGGRGRTPGGRGGRRGRRGPPQQQQQQGGPQAHSELRSREQILKQRKKKQKQQFLQSGGLKKLRQKSRQRLSDVRKSGFGRGTLKKGS